MDSSYVLTSEKTKKTNLCIFLSKRREKQIGLSNKLQDEPLKGITDLSVK